MAFIAAKKGLSMLRWKNVCGRIALELMFGDLVEWDGAVGTVNTTKLARKINVRPVRLVEYMEELHELGYLAKLDISYRTITFKFINTKWASGHPVSAWR